MNRSADLHRDHEPQSLQGLARHYLKDAVYGANDGIITTFAVVAGVAGAQLDARIVLILGFANLLADGFSMGASNFLSIRSDEAARAADGHGPREPFPLRHSTVTFAAFVVAGTIPLVSYLLPMDPGHRFGVGVALTLLTLFGVGAARTFVTRSPWLRGGFEMLAVGALAAAVAYGMGSLIQGITA